MRGDDDLIANGILVDVGAPATSVKTSDGGTTVTSDGGGGGGSSQVTPVLSTVGMPASQL